MRLTIAILACKLLHLIGGLIGRGSSLPGQIALRLCPDALGRVKLPGRVIAVTGSNGKTSTVEMIAAALTAAGRQVVWNREGSNQIEGVATLLLTRCTLGGQVQGDVVLLECDERYAKLTFRWFHPTHFVITNLYRDQLTRNGHPEWVYAAIEPALHPDTTLILNADDPLVSRFAVGRDPEKVKWFGLEACSVSAKEHRGVYHDGLRCPVCFGPMEYSCYHYAHIGHYRCAACGYARHAPDFAGTSLDLAAGLLSVNGGAPVELALHSIYQVYNVLAAWAACALCGVELSALAAGHRAYALKNGRMITFTLGRRRGTLLTSKHENSVAYDTNLGYIRDRDEDCAVMVIVDAVSRKYFTGETSWLWDIDFDLLDAPHVKQVILCGRYANDLALRFDYTRLDPEKVEVRDSVGEGVELLLAEEDAQSQPLPLYVVTCFSDRDKLLAHVKRD